MQQTGSLEQKPIEQLNHSRVFHFESLPAHKNPNGSESRNVVHGELATGEHVAVHESVQPPGVRSQPCPPHRTHRDDLRSRGHARVPPRRHHRARISRRYPAGREGDDAQRSQRRRRSGFLFRGRHRRRCTVTTQRRTIFMSAMNRRDLCLAAGAFAALGGLLIAGQGTARDARRRLGERPSTCPNRASSASTR